MVILFSKRRLRFAIVALYVCVRVPHTLAQDLPVDQGPFFETVEFLGEQGREIALAEGKDALIAQYENLIAQYPDLAKTVQLATQIGVIHEWDLTEAGQPPDLQAAYETYLGVIDRYDPSNDYMKKVFSLAANRALSLDPENARSLYERMMTQYPDDDSMQLEGLQGLAKLAELNGDTDTARDLYEQMLKYRPRNPSGYYGEGSNAINLQDAAAASLMGEAIRKETTREGRMAALEKMMEKYPELMARHRELVEQFRETIENQDLAPVDDVAQPEVPKPAVAANATMAVETRETQATAMESSGPIAQAAETTVAMSGDAPRSHLVRVAFFTGCAALLLVAGFYIRQRFV
ncbi:MAG: hypothetical protein AMXMBFR84_00540 [Candidatus Hydrogenedentota bacterium]